ncbi:Trypsin [Rubrobacter xylanophilus DSM 9941]|uniref:S1 family peptidase n=1 Tax=Rubrobacter xylanophilus TaxID=49319 RepID=UPI001C64133F|nr:serine protease [Rubrobacter xylanophilus]QYJ17029.1 Trypsin [Rubrobacter xylanophilus DSM 9941]
MRALPSGLSAAALAWLVATLLLVLAAPGAGAEVYEPQVVGGEGVPSGKYPFVASIQSSRVNTPSGHFCGGTLIDRDSVLTAAHCAEIITRRPTDSSLSYREVRVVVGRTLLRSDQGQVRRIESFSDVRIHPGYRNFAFDAAVINLDRPIRGIRPVRLATAGQDYLERPGRRVIAAGWGNTVPQSLVDAVFGTGGLQIPNRMQEVSVPVVSDRFAQQTYGSLDWPYVPRLMVAAGDSDLDTCQGDSGGPLFDRTGSGYIQIGITSFGLGCGVLNFPGVYAEVNAPEIRSFIVRAAGL